jgi:peptide/nickel transport system ATP-binding protein
MTALALRDLTVVYDGRPAVRHVSLAVDAGDVVALVGESGSGKSTVALAAIGLLPANAAVTGEVRIGTSLLAALSEAERDRLRGGEIAMIFQEPMTALNPIMTIGAQVAETVRIHSDLSRRDARRRAEQVLARVELPRDYARRYPHQLSGGQRQRAAIAVAIAAGPKLLIADEPTTALDVTTQAQILALLRRLVQEDAMALLLVSHDLAVVAQTADRVIVMKEGETVEEGPPAILLGNPENDYTKRLIAASRHVPARPDPPGNAGPPLLEVRGLIRDHAGRRNWLGRHDRHRAVDDVSFTMARGETVGIIGESGAGKTSLLRVILALERPQSGDVLLGGSSILGARGAALRRLRRDIQVVFQDPVSSFDPRQRVEQIVAEPLHLLDIPPDNTERRAKVKAALEQVGLSATDADRYPHQFSGGQRQRIAIARALIIEPALVVLDEAVSALDVSLRADILDLLASLSTRRGLSYLFVSHDLSVMRHFADRLIVMKEGRIVEQGHTADILAAPASAYTVALLDATPDLDRTLAQRRIQA